MTHEAEIGSLIICIVIAIIICGKYFISWFMTPPSTTNDLVIKKSKKAVSLYKRKNDFISKNEKKFFYSLKTALQGVEGIHIHCQVTLINLIEPIINEESEINEEIEEAYNSLIKKILSKRIDFVITDNELNVLVAIELDDASHNRPERIERDEFVNNALKGNHRLLRFNSQKYYNPEFIKASLMQHTLIFNKDIKKNIFNKDPFKVDVI